MKLKSYRAHSVEDAIRLARVDLGGDALFVGSRPLQSPEDSQAGHEVTFVVIEASAKEAMNARALPGERPAAWLAARLHGWAEESSAAAGAANKAGNGKAVNGQAQREQTRSAAKPPIWEWLFSPKSQQGGRGQPWRAPEVSESPGEAPAVSHGPSTMPPLHGGSRASSAEAPAATRPAAAQESFDEVYSYWRKATRAENKKAERPHWRDFLPVGLGSPEEADSESRKSPVECSVPVGLEATKEAAGTRGAAEAAPAPALKAPGWAAALAAPTPAEVHSAAESSRDARASPCESPSNQPPEQLTAELEQTRALLGRALSSPRPLSVTDGKMLLHPRLAEIYGRLASAEVEPSLAARLIGGLEEAARQGADRKRLRALLHAELAKLWKLCGPLGKPASDPRIVALLGPSGAGKTTSLGKLAVRFGVVQGRRVHLVSVDPQRVGAVELLQAYAALLGAPLTIVEQCEGLPAALRSLSECEPRRRPELVLIDSCGYGPADWARARRLAQVLAARDDVDTHLVLSLASKGSDLRRTVERYAIFRPDRLLFTKADETDAHGALLNESVRSGLPLSYVTSGQRVPEDITPASADYLTRLLLKNDLTQ